MDMQEATVMASIHFQFRHQSMVRLLAAVFISTLLLYGCSGGGKEAAVAAPQASATVTGGLLKLGTLGTSSDLIAGMDLRVNLPAGVTVAADPSSGETAAGAVTLSGAAAAGGNSLLAAKYAPATAGTPATLHIVVISAAGLRPGEFATVSFNLAAGASLPALNAFTMASFSAKGLDSSTITGVATAPLSVVAAGNTASAKQTRAQVVNTGIGNSSFMNIVVDTPTKNSSQTITGTCKWEPGYQLTIAPTNTAVTVSVPVISPDGTWSAQVSGLVEGKNVIAVTDTDALGTYVGSVSATIILDTKKPDLSVAASVLGTKNSRISIGGTVDDYLYHSVMLEVDCPTATVDMATAAVPDWSAMISNLTYGDNTCHVTATDLAGNHDSKDVLIHYDNLAPDLDIHFNDLVKYGTVQTISGKVESGITPVMTVNGSDYAGAMTVNGSDWSCQLSGLAEGANTITVTATDTSGNVSTRTATITTIAANGSFSGLSQPRIADALKALRIAVGFDQPTVAELLHGDLYDDGKIDLADAILILKKVVNL
jgi:hypothetical protein